MFFGSTQLTQSSEFPFSVIAEIPWLHPTIGRLCPVKANCECPAAAQIMSCGETREKASADLKRGCEEVLAHLLSSEHMAEIKKLRESGSSPNEVASKVEEFAKNITDEEKIKNAKKYETNCKKIFGVSSSRRRRHENGTHHHHTLEDYLESSHLSW